MSIDKNSTAYRKYLGEFREFYQGWSLDRISRDRIDIRELVRKKGEIPWMMARIQVATEIMDRQINGRYQGDSGGRGVSIRK
jgi:hypothetical protein